MLPISMKKQSVPISAGPDVKVIPVQSQETTTGQNDQKSQPKENG